MSEAAMAQMRADMDSMLFEIADLKRRLANMIRPGTVKSFDAAKNTAKLDLGLDDGNDTHDIPNAGNSAHSGGQHWSGLSAGMQITALCPEGELDNACFIPGGYHDGVTPPSARDDEDVIARDGAHVRVRAGGFVQLSVASIDKLKIVIGGAGKQFKPDVFDPSSPLGA